MDVYENHRAKVARIAERIRNYLRSGDGQGIRFFHGSSNTTRPNREGDFVVDISDLDGVLEIDTSTRSAVVEPNVSMERLVNETLKRGLLPAVVMEFPAITCGGAVNGAALESSSYRYGQFSDICTEYEIVLGDGSIVNVSPQERADLFYSISGSYGSLGLLTLLNIRLVDAAPYVRVTYYPTDSFESTLGMLKDKLTDPEADYLDGIIFGSDLGVVMTGKLVHDSSLSVRSYRKATDDWFYERAEEAARNRRTEEELVPIRDYLFRYDRGVFWMGNYAFPLIHIKKNAFTKFLFNPVATAKKLFEGLSTLNVSQEYFVQDVYVPFESASDLLAYNQETTRIYPLWLCPLQSTATAQKLSPHFLLDPMLLDIGFWGQTGEYLADPVGINRKFEAFIRRIRGRKMLYAHAYYTETEFWEIYDQLWYRALREKYHAEGVFPDVWNKTGVKGKLKPMKWKGLFLFFVLHPLKRIFD